MFKRHGEKLNTFSIRLNYGRQQPMSETCSRVKKKIFFVLRFNGPTKFLKKILLVSFSQCFGSTLRDSLKFFYTLLTFSVKLQLQSVERRLDIYIYICLCWLVLPTIREYNVFCKDFTQTLFKIWFEDKPLLTLKVKYVCI